MTWAPTGYGAIPTAPKAGDYAVLLASAIEGRTAQKGLPKVDLRLKFESGYQAVFSLIFGVAPWLDQRSSQMMDTLFRIAGLSADDHHDLDYLAIRLAGIPIGVVLEKDPSPSSRSGLRLVEVFELEVDGSEEPQLPEGDGEGYSQEGDGNGGTEFSWDPGTKESSEGIDAPVVRDLGDEGPTASGVAAHESLDLSNQSDDQDQLILDDVRVNPGFREL